MTVVAERMTAKIDGDFVVFLIGMRVNAWWKVGDIVRVGRSMVRMIEELEKRPESGFLGAEQWGGRTSIMVQYWRSLDQLMAYARDPESEHFPAWRDFNRRIGKSGEVGIWHETYLVPAGRYETVYNHMPQFGLARAAGWEPATGTRRSARGRLGETAGDDAPIDEQGEVTGTNS